MLRIMHRVCGPALGAAFLLIGMSAMGITDAAAQGSPEARQACTPDAMRLCSEFTSDVSQTTKCMMAKRGQLSAVCRMAMDTGLPIARIRVNICTTGIARTVTAADFLMWIGRQIKVLTYPRRIENQRTPRILASGSLARIAGSSPSMTTWGALASTPPLRGATRRTARGPRLGASA
jgi:hypothetical protein